MSLPLAEVWSNGGGTQSIATAVLVLTGRLPKPDLGVIVDTTRETSPTWASACWMCPNHHNGEWLRLKLEQPAEFEKACALEDEIRQRDPHAWLHRSCVPLREVDFEQPDLFSRPCDSGVCFV